MEFEDFLFLLKTYGQNTHKSVCVCFCFLSFLLKSISVDKILYKNIQEEGTSILQVLKGLLGGLL